MRKFLTILFFFYCGLLKAQTTYYVDTTGNDTNNGTSISTPWKTVAKVNASTFAAGSVINFKRGMKWSGTLIPPSSGSSGNPIIFGAYGSGAKPIITGLTNLLTWVNEGSNIWAAVFNAGAVNSSTHEFLMTVVRNGKLTAQGRWPNFTAAEKGYRHQESHTTYTVTDNELTGTPSWNGGQYVTRAEEYNILKARITGHSTTTLTHVGLPFYQAKNGWGYFIQNHPATLDSLGEWYYDSTATKLKMYSTSDPNSIGTGVQAAGINNLCTITSKSYIIIANIRFEGADENGIVMTSCSNIEIQNCEFEWMSHSAIAATFTNSTNIFDNIFRNLNGSGIFMESECNGTTINNNTFQTIGLIPGMHVGLDKHGSAMVLGQLSTSSLTQTVTNNVIDSTGNNGIVFSAKNASIKNNRVTNFSQIIGDFGGIYTGSGDEYYGSGGSRVVESNVVLYSGAPWEGTNHTSGSGYLSVKGIYMDEPMNHLTVKNNTVGYINQAALLIHRATDMTITGNTLFNSGTQFVWLNQTNDPAAVRNNIIKHNVMFSKTVDQTVIDYWVYQSDISLWGAIDSNYLINPFRQYGLWNFQNMSNGKTIYHDINSWRAYYPAHDANSVYNASTLSQYGSVAWAANAGTNTTSITTSNWDELFLWNVPAGLTVGQKYRVRFSIKSNTTAKANLIVNFFQQSPNIVIYAPLETTLRNVDFMFTANATGGLISLRQSDEGSLCNYTISNIIIDRVTGTTPVDSTRFEYNAAAGDKHINMQGRHKDAKGLTYNNQVTLNPFTSKVFVKDRSFVQANYPKITALYNEYTYDLRAMEGEGDGHPFGLVNGGYDPKNGVTTLGTPLDNANLKTSIHPSTKAYVYNSETYGSQIDFDLKINYNINEIWLYEWGFNDDSLYILAGDWNTGWDTLVAHKTTGQSGDWGWKQFIVSAPSAHKIRAVFINPPYVVDSSDGVAEITEMVLYGDPSGTPPVRPSTVYSGARQPAPTVKDFLWVNTWKEIRDMKWWKPFGGVRLYKHREWTDTAAVNTFPTKVYREDPFPSDIDSLQVRNYTQYLKNMGIKTYISYKEAPQYIRTSTGGEGRVFVTDIYGQDPRNKNYYRTDSMFMNHKAKLYGSKVYSLDSVYISDVAEFSGLNTMTEIQIGNEELAWSNFEYWDPVINAAHSIKAYEGIKQADTATKVIMSPYTKPDTSALKVQLYAQDMMGDTTKQYYDGGIAYHQYQFRGQNEFPATNVYDAGPTKLYGQTPELFDFLPRARKIREATYRYAGNVPLFIDEFNWNRNPASPFTVPLIRTLDAASSQGCLLVKTLNYGLFAGLDRMAIYWMVNDVGDGGGGIFDAMGLMDAPPPLFSEIPFDSYYWVATFGNVLADYKPLSMDTTGAVWKFKYQHKTLSDSVAYFLAAKDTGYTTANYSLFVGNVIHSVKVVTFSDTRDTGLQVKQTAPAGSTTVLGAGYIPKLILTREGTPVTNGAPVVNAGANVSMILPTNSVSLSGTAVDPEGDVITGVVWSYISGPVTFTLSSTTILNPLLSNLVAGVYVFRLSATDELGAIGTDDIQVTVAGGNLPPVAVAGSDRFLNLPQDNIFLNGTASSDTDGTIATYLWAQMSGPAFSINNPALASPTISGLGVGTYIIRLTVTDNLGATGYDEMTIVVGNFGVIQFKIQGNIKTGN